MTLVQKRAGEWAAGGWISVVDQGAFGVQNETKLRVAVNGYGVIGKRVADAVALQPDMQIVGADLLNSPPAKVQ